MKKLNILLSAAVGLWLLLGAPVAYGAANEVIMSQVKPTGTGNTERRVTSTPNSLIGFDASGHPVNVTAGTGITISSNQISSSGGSASFPLTDSSSIAANTITPRLTLINSGTASSGNQRYSPFIQQEGASWSGSSSDSIKYRFGVITSFGDNGRWVLQTSVNGGAWTDNFSVFGSTGILEVASLQVDSSFSANLVNASYVHIQQNVLEFFTNGGSTGTLTVSAVIDDSSDASLALNMQHGSRTLSMPGDATISGTHSGTSSGTNTGDQTISDATISTTDITTNNASTSKHGFLPKLDGNAAHFLDGTGAYSTPAGGGNVSNTGTPTSGQLASWTSATVVQGITTGTGILAALGVNTGSAGAPVLFNGALGTPSSGTVTNLTGTASININGTVGATTPTTVAATTGVFGSTTSLLLGTAGSAVGNIGFRNGTSGTATLAPPTGALGAYSVTLPNAASTLPIFGQQITFAGPTAAHTVTLPDAAFTVARTDAGNTFIGSSTATSWTFVTPALGTPASGVATNLTGTAAGLTAGTVTTNANLTGDVTSVGNAATVVKINGTSMAGLATGILKNTTTTGVPSIAIAADFPTLNQSTTGSAATLTTSRNIGGSAFNGSADVTSFPSPGAIGGTTPATGAFTTISATGKVTTPLSGTGGAGFILPHGAAPTSPVNGDVWTTTAGMFARINSVTVGPFGSSAADVTQSGANMFTGQNTTALNFEQAWTSQSTGAQNYAVNKSYYITTFNANSTATFTGTPGNGSRITVRLIACDGTSTFTYPTAQRDGSITGTSTVITPTAGEHVLSFTYVNSLWYFADTITGALNLAGGSSVVSGILPVANGGTNLASGTSGGVLAYTASGTLASSGALAANAIVVGGGAGAVPSTVTTGTGIITALGVNTGSAGAPVLFNGAGGTPSSLTLTNATGLPVSGITSSTITALGLGSIELGAASDTTIARSGAGVITVEGVTVDTISATNTLTNKRVTSRITTITSSATPTVNTDSCDCVNITALAAAITSMTSSLTGTPSDFDQLEYRIKDNATARAITWGASFASGVGTLPTTTTLSKVLHVYLEWDAVQSKWICAAAGSEP